MKCLIIADSPTKDIQVRENYDLVVCLDGVGNYLSKLNVRPDVIVGDLDTLDPTVRFAPEIKVIKVVDQNYSDTDKGIKYTLAQGATEIHIRNALGGRIDHTLYNLRSLRKYHDDKCRIKVLNFDEIAEFIKDQRVTLSGKTGDKVAIMALPKAVVNTKGLLYELSNYELDVGIKESSCNSLAETSAEIIIQGEALIVYPNRCLLSFS